MNSNIRTTVMRYTAAFSICGMLIAIVAGPVTAHGIFKKTLEARHENLRVTCNMCHVKGEPKTERNDFGQVLFEVFEGQDLSARWDAVEGDERKAFEQDVMVPALTEGLEKLYAREADDPEAPRYSEMIPAGQMDGTKLKKPR
ncbi:MAG: hypothetical protein ACR2NP_03965 [Pirellulaceae bacterium]